MVFSMPTRPKVTLSTLQTRKKEGQKISMITCYDYSTARIMEESGVDSLLVGDTYAEVCLGHATTLPMELDHLVTIAEAVRRGAPTVYLIGDMPYLTYQVSAEEAIRNAGKFMAVAGCDCVKVEVDRRLVRTVEAMSAASIPVMAHLGLRPQSINSTGGYKIQGRVADDAVALIEDARLMEQAGAIALLLEAVPLEVARIITERSALPVIGIVAGPHVNGQVVVFHDMIGYGGGHPPRSVRRYANAHDLLLRAFQEYVADVADQKFPVAAGSVAMDPVELEKLSRMLARGTDGKAAADVRGASLRVADD
jgi:3-methyl-2-oxobutanoate hydroxymethyltransferase